MSSNMPSNVVPMPHAQAAANPAQAPMPFPMWGGGGSLPWGPGCCPPGGMDALMKCYCDVQAATAFICSVMVQCIQQNPAVVQAIIAAIEASGSNLPLIGVTNGTDAQPGQVGEWVYLQQNVALQAGNSTQSVSMGILQAGDWDIWVQMTPNTNVDWISFAQQPLPPGFSEPKVDTYFANGTADEVIVSTTSRALISVASPIVLFVQVSNAGAATTAGLAFMARRRR